jgi:hypothetical protein
MRRNILISALTLPALVAGCGLFDWPFGTSSGALLGSSSFVVRGQMEIEQGARGPCPVFLAETGLIYHLFQHPNLANEEFDGVITPGAVSRLEVRVRNDLHTVCRIGTSVEVLKVLELVPPAG